MCAMKTSNQANHYSESQHLLESIVTVISVLAVASINFIRVHTCELSVNNRTPWMTRAAS